VPRAARQTGCTLIEFGDARGEPFGERGGLLQFARHPLEATLHFAHRLLRATRLLLRPRAGFRGLMLIAIGHGERFARRFRRELCTLALAGGTIESFTQRGQLGATLQRTGAGAGAGQEHGAAGIDERLATVLRLHLAEQRAHPGGRRGRPPARRMPDRARHWPRDRHHGVERQQQQGTGVGRGVPATHGVGRCGITHHHRVQRGPEVPLHQPRRITVGREEVGERPQHGAVAERVAILEQTLRTGREAHALAFEPLERRDLPFERRMRFHAARQQGARFRIGGARGGRSHARALERLLRLLHFGAEQFELLAGAHEFALRGIELIGERSRSRSSVSSRCCDSPRSRAAPSRSSSNRRA
jgi:hypothetical protein